jgi:hypothetical protein
MTLSIAASNKNMEDSNLLEEVIDSLEQDSNVLRIKRLILFTCHNIWSNDGNEIKSLSMHQLIRELMLAFPDLKLLKQKLSNHIKQLSKQSEYLLAADSIIDSIGFLYTLRDEGKLPKQFLEIIAAQKIADISTETTEIDAYQIDVEPSQLEIYEGNAQDTIPHKHNLKYLTNLFDLRADICRNISPLHVKILLFSSLHYSFSPQERDWSALYAYDIDDLIQAIFVAHPTLEELQRKLASVSETLDQPEEAKRAAQEIVQVLRPFY